jgi:hypothetical protein
MSVNLAGYPDSLSKIGSHEQILLKPQDSPRSLAIAGSISCTSAHVPQANDPTCNHQYNDSPKERMHQPKG